MSESNKFRPTNTPQHPQPSLNRIKPRPNNLNSHRKFILSRLNQPSQRRHNILSPRDTKNLLSRNNSPIDSLRNNNSFPSLNL